MVCQDRSNWRSNSVSYLILIRLCLILWEIGVIMIICIFLPLVPAGSTPRFFINYIIASMKKIKKNGQKRKKLIIERSGRERFYFIRNLSSLLFFSHTQFRKIKYPVFSGLVRSIYIP